MIQEAYCSKEVSELLREKGFLKGVNLKFIPNLAFYDNIGLHYNVAKWYDSLIQDEINFVVAPTHHMAMAWLREEKNIFIVIEPHAYDYVNERNKSYVCSLWVGDTYYEYLESRDYPSYEEAVEAALKYSLENLI